MAVDVAMVPLATPTVMSRAMCADKCLRLDQCATFTFSTLDKVCKLYDDGYSEGRVSIWNTNVYTRRDICC
ncbi:hypothetical protein DPMN_190434 [Dreissena polymorpha]|uniref:Apple domain-containing protein n=1 Tax=Dreissena polymorpha TaxID=45954 RepID=A0A9D4DWU2_DREPO|nr:hypothetical protein DPMN_190434 [Dreissena polymorpha]